MIALPESPTMELPGTQGKIAILAERVRKCQQLFHPLDKSMEEDDVRACLPNKAKAHKHETPKSAYNRIKRVYKCHSRSSA